MSEVKEPVEEIVEETTENTEPTESEMTEVGDDVPVEGSEAEEV